MKYRKLPVEIEARKLPTDVLGDNYDEARSIAEWAAAVLQFLPGEWSLVIPTLEGDMVASPGDYVICGVQGEFYPCKPEIFEATYEPA